MLGRSLAALAVAAILTTPAAAQQRQSTYEPETLLNPPTGTTNFHHSSGVARDCMNACLHDRRCGFWLYVIENTCLLYEGQPASRHIGRPAYVAGQIIRR